MITEKPAMAWRRIGLVYSSLHTPAQGLDRISNPEQESLKSQGFGDRAPKHQEVIFLSPAREAFALLSGAFIGGFQVMMSGRSRVITEGLGLWNSVRRSVGAADFSAKTQPIECTALPPSSHE